MTPEAERWPIGAALSVALFGALLLAPRVLNDADTLWQIRSGEWMLAHRAIPFGDPFSFTMAGQPWPPHQWLGQLALAAAYDLGGWSAVRALAAAAAAITFGLLLRHLRPVLRPLPALALAVVGCTLVGPSLLARPHLIALPFLELWCAGLVMARRQGARPPWPLLLVMTLWANLHGSFPVGLVLVAALAVEAAAAEPTLRSPAVRGWLLFTALAFLAACLTPQGPAGLLFPVQHLAMHNLDRINEWQPADFGRLGPLEIVILLALYFGLTGQVKVPQFRVVLLLGLLHAALTHGRNGQLLGIIGPLLIADAIGASLPPPRVASESFGRGGMALACIAAMLLAARLAIASAGPAMPIAALNDLPACLRTRPVLNDYRFGAALIFNGIAPFVDSRAELYGDAFLDDYTRIADGDPDAITAALRRWDIAWALFPPGNSALRVLEQGLGWHRLHADTQAIALARPDPECGH